MDQMMAMKWDKHLSVITMLMMVMTTDKASWDELKDFSSGF
jgi:hypothetical protein